MFGVNIVNSLPLSCPMQQPNPLDGLLAIKNAAAGLIHHLQSERSEVLEFLDDSFDDERFHETVSVRSQSSSQAIAD